MDRRVPSVLDDEDKRSQSKSKCQKEEEDDPEDQSQPLECAVCLQTCVHPVQLQCRHIFCFLCVKGVAIQSKRCPMCRREIPPDYLEHPDLVQGPLELALASEEGPQLAAHEGQVGEEEEDEASSSRPDESRWFYEGRNGWWEYDVRTGQDLEQYFKEGDTSCEMLIAGFLYIIDFQNMFQYRRNEPNRRRRIKRDVLSNIDNWKGVAGLRPASSTSTPSSSSTDNPSSSDGSSAVAQLLTDMSTLSLSTNAADRSRDNLPTTSRRGVERIRAVNNTATRESDAPREDASSNRETNPE